MHVALFTRFINWHSAHAMLKISTALGVSCTEILTHLCCSNLAVFGEALGSAEAFSGEDLAECMIYRRRSWKGILPVSHLAQWALDRQVSHRQALTASAFAACIEMLGIFISAAQYTAMSAAFTTRSLVSVAFLPPVSTQPCLLTYSCFTTCLLQY